MLGDFRYSKSHDGEDVVVRMFWDQGKRMGEINVPYEVAWEIGRSEMPATGGHLGLFSAIGYGIYLAGEMDRRLLLTGDRTVWEDRWGHLVEAN